MKIIFLSNNDIISAINFAIHTTPFHYHRMWKTNKEGFSKIVIGKLGEIAVAKYLQINGITTAPNLFINTGIDSGDLTLFNQIIAVKSKNFIKKELPSFDEIFLHIPVDQYSKLKRDKTSVIVAVALRCLNLPIERWATVPSIKAGIVGVIKLSEYNEIKVLHKEGEEVTPGFKLPPPDSWAVAWSQLYPVSVIIEAASTF